MSIYISLFNFSDAFRVNLRGELNTYKKIIVGGEIKENPDEIDPIEEDSEPGVIEENSEAVLCLLLYNNIQQLFGDGIFEKYNICKDDMDKKKVTLIEPNDKMGEPGEQEIFSYSVLAYNDKRYVFSWDKIPGEEGEDNDNRRLLEFLVLKLGINWAKNAKIEKIDNNKTIKVFTEKNSLLLKLNDEKTEVLMEIDNVKTNKLAAEMKNDKLNIYEKRINKKDTIVVIRSPEMGFQPNLLRTYLRAILRTLHLFPGFDDGVRIKVFGAGGAICEKDNPGTVHKLNGSIFVGSEIQKKDSSRLEKYYNPLVHFIGLTKENDIFEAIEIKFPCKEGHFKKSEAQNEAKNLFKALSKQECYGHFIKWKENKKISPFVFG